MTVRENFESDARSRQSDLAAVLATLMAHYTFDGEGRIVALRAGTAEEGRRRAVASEAARRSADAGQPPRFVLGRAVEGCVWRFRVDLGREQIGELARFAAREPGVAFDGNLPAPPERLAVLARVLEGEPLGSVGRSVSRDDAKGPVVRRDLVTRSGVTLGEIWSFD